MIYFVFWWVLCGLVSAAVALIFSQKKLTAKNWREVGGLLVGLIVGLLINVCFGPVALLGAMILLSGKKNDSST